MNKFQVSKERAKERLDRLIHENVLRKVRRRCLRSHQRGVPPPVVKPRSCCLGGESSKGQDRLLGEMSLGVCDVTYHAVATEPRRRSGGQDDRHG